MVLQPLDLSLGETEALIAKAARGAGYPWGLAAEAGSAARAMIASGAPDVEAAFADFLEAAALHAPNADICPIRRGLLRADGMEPPATPTDWPLVEAAFTTPPGAMTRATISPETLARLDALAARTYAPATEESRARGAG